MREANFKAIEARSISAEEWLHAWAAQYPDDDYEKDYRKLIQKIRNDGHYSYDDLVLIGKWKDNAYSENRWKENVASVSYKIWDKAAKELQKFQIGEDIQVFLNKWSEQPYEDMYPNGKIITKKFGLSRASTLLHFLSKGEYPIYDSRVRTAIARLFESRLPPNTVKYYCKNFAPFFNELAEKCQVQDKRKLDKALFSFGAEDFLRPSKFQQSTTEIP